MSGGKWLSISFNYNSSCFIVGTSLGFIVYDSKPVQERFQVNFGKGIGFAEILHQSNIVALVGGGNNPAFPKNTLILWNDKTSETIAEIQCNENINGIKIRLDKIIISTWNSKYIYDTRKMRLIHKFETFPDRYGLCAIGSTVNQTLIIAIPSEEQGYVRLEYFNPSKSKTIKAHESALKCICISLDGRYLATTSIKGTLIRIFDISDKNTIKQTYEFRRGSDEADIYSMSFSPNSKFFIINSDKYNAHVFSLSKKELNTQSMLGGWGYFSITNSIWSATKISLPHCFSKISFILPSKKDSESDFDTQIIVVSVDKGYYEHKLVEIDGKLQSNTGGYKQLDQTNLQLL